MLLPYLCRRRKEGEEKKKKSNRGGRDWDLEKGRHREEHRPEGGK